MTEATRHELPDAETLADILAGDIAARLDSAIVSRGQATIAVSGGKSPIQLFERLAAKPLDWSKVAIAQVDERWIDPDHEASNARMIRAHLLTSHAEQAAFVPMKVPETTAALGQPSVERIYRGLTLPFDIMLLGMGEDGHTASIFPGAPEFEHLMTTPDLTAAATANALPHERMTLTRAGILNSRRIILPVSGLAKRAMLERVMADGPVEELPVRLIFQQSEVPVAVWTSV